MCKTVGPEALVSGFGDSEESQDSYYPLLSVFALILAKAFCAVGSDKPQEWDRCVHIVFMQVVAFQKNIFRSIYSGPNVHKRYKMCKTGKKSGWEQTAASNRQTYITHILLLCGYISSHHSHAKGHT